MAATDSKITKAEIAGAAKKVAFNPVMDALTRIGYGARGLIYVTMGLLSLSVALGKGGTPASQQGAIEAIGKQPAGLILLWVILLGLISYSLWGVIRAILDPLHKGRNTKGLLVRGGYLLSAISYALLILPTFEYITGAGRSAQSGAGTQQSLQTMMTTPLGRLAVGLVGLVVIIVGVIQIRAGFNAKFDQQFKSYQMSAREVRWATQLGRFGTATRGFVLILVGLLMDIAAYKSSASQGIGIDAALKALLDQPYGIWLLGIVAVGLIAFGAYSICGAIWFRLRH